MGELTICKGLAVNGWPRLGEADNSLARLEQAFQNREPESLYVKSEPAFDWMRSNPRFRALIAAIKLP